MEADKTVIVILGAAVWADGPSPTLTRRTAHAARLYHQRAGDVVMPCGGMGAHPPTEADMMAELLQGAGVPTDRIIKEDRSTTTYENLQFARDLLRPMSIDHVVIVTDWYHGPRAKLVAIALNMRTTTAAPKIVGAHWPTQLRMALREGAALPAYALRLIWAHMTGRPF